MRLCALLSYFGISLRRDSKDWEGNADAKGPEIYDTVTI
jgi:hypothetical protein